MNRACQHERGPALLSRLVGSLTDCTILGTMIPVVDAIHTALCSATTGLRLSLLTANFVDRSLSHYLLNTDI